MLRKKSKLPHIFLYRSITSLLLLSSFWGIEWRGMYGAAKNREGLEINMSHLLAKETRTYLKVAIYSYPESARFQGHINEFA